LIKGVESKTPNQRKNSEALKKSQVKRETRKGEVSRGSNPHPGIRKNAKEKRKRVPRIPYIQIGPEKKGEREHFQSLADGCERENMRSAGDGREK